MERKRNAFLSGSTALGRVFTNLAVGTLRGAFFMWKKVFEVAKERNNFALRSLKSGAVRRRPRLTPRLGPLP